MKPFLILPFLLVTASGLIAAEPIKFVSPDQSSVLVVDKSGRRDLIELRSGKTVHRLFEENLDSTFKPKLAKAFDASLNKVGRIVPPTFTSARWVSPDEVEIKGRSSVIINNDNGDAFSFTASVTKSGTVRDVTVTPVK
ncbi:MAG: hypothetical protein JO015_15180 [Verrucomicrobia bacterium]|nr:hypothetical protein [Verrucomicrobiota bacterium]